MTIRQQALTDALACARMRVQQEANAVLLTAHRPTSDSHLFAVAELAYQRALLARLEARLREVQ